MLDLVSKRKLKRLKRKSKIKILYKKHIHDKNISLANGSIDEELDNMFASSRKNSSLVKRIEMMK